MDNFQEIERMKEDIERILKKNTKFGPLHRLTTSEDGELLLSWENAVLRPKARANNPAYVTFMEEIADVLLDFGYCLEADVDATETERNDYFLIVPDTDDGYDTESEWD